jgi:hypothetical protein
MESASLAAKLIPKTLAGEPVDWDESYTAPMRRAYDVYREFTERWYEGGLGRVLLALPATDPRRRAITSILGGNVIERRHATLLNPQAALDMLAETLGTPTSS